MAEAAVPLRVASRASRTPVVLDRLRRLLGARRFHNMPPPAPCFGRMKPRDEMVARGLALRCAAVAEVGAS